MIEFFQNIAYFLQTILHGIKVSFTYLPKFFVTFTAGLGQVLAIFNEMPPFLLHVGLPVLLVAFIFLILKIFHG